YIKHPTKTVRIDRATVASGRTQFLHARDIVLVIKGSVGKTGIVPRDVPPAGPEGWSAGQSCIILRSKRSDIITPEALAIQLRSPVGQESLRRISSGATIPLIRSKELVRMPILVPDEATARKAAAALEEEARL